MATGTDLFFLAYTSPTPESIEIPGTIFPIHGRGLNIAREFYHDSRDRKLFRDSAWPHSNTRHAPNALAYTKNMWMHN
jgi:hypothetical protein